MLSAAIAVMYCGSLTSVGDEQAAAAGHVTLERPRWSEGDRWVVETRTKIVQSVAKADGQPRRVRWQFEIAGVERVAAAECFKICVTCLVEAKLRPSITLWYDKQTLFLRKFEAQIVARGEMRTLCESYTAASEFAPVIPPLEVIPVSLPAFVPAGAKHFGSFTYVSHVASAGSKDLSLVRFAHTVRQDVERSSQDLIRHAAGTGNKVLATSRPVEVHLAEGNRQIAQLWERDIPWPVYTNQGQTEAWLVSIQRADTAR
jgi:hypothetical protein